MKNRMWRFVTLAVVVMMVGTALIACGAKPTEAPPTPVPEKAPAAQATPVPEAAKPTVAPETKALVGVILPTKDEPRWLQDQAVFQKAGWDPLFSQGDSAKEKANVESLISQGVKVIIITPQDATAAAAAAQAARDAGVKVISYDRLIRDTDAVDYYVTFDSMAVGASWSKYLIEQAGNTKGNPLYIYTGAPTDNNAFIFFEGAWEEIQPKIADGTFVIKNSSEAVALQDKPTLTRDEQAKIIGQTTTNWDFNVAKNLAEANLTAAAAADKGTVYILAPNDGTARSIADAFAADKDVTKYFVTGQDAEKASVQYVIDGKQSMTVLKDVRTLAADAVAAANAYLSGGTPEKTNSYNNGKIDVPAKPSAIVTVTKENVKQALIDSGYYQASDFTGLEAAAAEAPVAEDVTTKQADPNNRFPNGIGEVDCKGVNLVVATQTGPQIASPVENFWKEWGDKTGGTVEVQTFPFGDLFAKIRTGYLSGSSPFDIVIYASDWAGDIMGPGYVIEIPQKNQDQMGYDYLIPTYRDRILAWGGKTYAAPYDGDSHMIYYRADLLTNPEHQAAFKAQFGYDLPAPPKTWKQYVDIATYFQGKTIDGQTIYGAGTAFKPKAQSYWTFLGVAASYAKAPDDPGYFFDPDTMEPRINNPGFVEALNTYIALSKVGPPDVLNWDVGNIRGGFPAGQVVLGIDWGDVGPLAADPKSSAIVGKWGSAMEPGVDRYWDSKKGAWVDKFNQAPFLAFGGWVQSVSKTTKNQECALDFITFMGSQNMSALLVTTAGSGVNPHYYSDGNNLEPWLKVGMTEAQAKEYLGAVTDILAHPNAVVDLRITGAAEYFDALDTQLARAVAGEVDAQAALDQVAKDWNAITDRLGRDQQKTLYRQQLGLPTD